MSLKDVVSLDYEAKEKLYGLMSEIIEKATDDQDGAQINRVEESLNRFVMREWNLLVSRAIESAVSFVNGVQRETLREADQRKIERRLETILSEIDEKIRSRLESEVTKIYKLNRTRFQNQHKLKKRMSKSELLKADFGSSDELIIDALSKLHLISVSDHYSNNHKTFISEMIKTNVIDRGLPKKEAGIALKEQLSRRLGGFEQSVPETIRSQGQLAASAYFDGLSATTVTRARNFGQINLMDEAGVTRVIWSSVEDERTSEICLAMNGRVFTLDLVKAQQNRILEQTSADAVKELFPWRKDLSEFGLGRGDRVSSYEASQLLAENGVPIVPPAHFRCRSELIPG